jgi:hypothetical protein
MRNPWQDLPEEPPYVLDMDEDALARVRRDLQLDALPVPYIGSLTDATVCYLLLNPGLANDEERQSAHARRQLLSALTFESSPPFWPLKEQLSETSGYKWWKPRLRALADEVGWDTLSHRLMCIQYFPYHSRTFTASTVRLPSQAWALTVLRSAIQKRLTFVLGRGVALWESVAPEFVGADRVILNAPRAAHLSPDNMAASSFKELVRCLQKAR